ncbi:PLP-dependent aminotransferase family protein [Phyllobacterium salinisoli]|uniref:PLP-dependent aminotransferase family protein n=1 Tax=Phyllobacterium salinisoli TaxID=1899321 RepID=A0A368K046_9HYPH|nr:PLP-dependent aminotransferase family protein [Phyllobacterium salinisoli]RCS21330.1 PLP-dependent aminotransferase family protein [Phyllobacterium salinisoli]
MSGTDADMRNSNSTDEAASAGPAASMPLYMRIASELSLRIASGDLPTGAKLTSLRGLAKQKQISVATVEAAYGELLSSGMIEARPKSGYYVCDKGRPAAKLPSRTRPNGSAATVSVSKPSLALLEHASNPKMAPFGCAIPATDVLETARLDRLMNRLNKAADGNLNIYGTPMGLSELRQQIARRHAAMGDFPEIDDILITNGCTEALYLALQAVTEPGDTVAVESPVYFGVLQIMETLGLKALELPTDHKGVSLDALEGHLRKGGVSACLLSSSFSNPMGATMPASLKETLLELLGRFNTPLIEDDVYGDLDTGDARPKPFISLSSATEVIYCSSFSKSLAPGYRVGWIRSKSRMHNLVKRKFSTTLCSAPLPQIAIARYIQSGAYDRHLRRLRKILRKSVHETRSELMRCLPAGSRISNPAGGFVLWAELPPTVDTNVMFKRALAENLCFAPGALFSASGNYRNCFRVSCGHHWNQAIKVSIRRLGELTHQLQ